MDYMSLVSMVCNIVMMSVMFLDYAGKKKVVRCYAVNTITNHTTIVISVRVFVHTE